MFSEVKKNMRFFNRQDYLHKHVVPFVLKHNLWHYYYFLIVNVEVIVIYMLTWVLFWININLQITICNFCVMLCLCHTFLGYGNVTVFVSVPSHEMWFGSLAWTAIRCPVRSVIQCPCREYDSTPTQGGRVGAIAWIADASTSNEVQAPHTKAKYLTWGAGTLHEGQVGALTQSSSRCPSASTRL